MKKIVLLMLLLLLTNCATGTYISKDGDNSNLNHDKSFPNNKTSRLLKEFKFK